MKAIYLSKKDIARKLGIISSTINLRVKCAIMPMLFSLGHNKLTWDEHEVDE